MFYTQLPQQQEVSGVFLSSNPFATTVPGSQSTMLDFSSSSTSQHQSQRQQQQENNMVSSHGVLLTTDDKNGYRRYNGASLPAMVTDVSHSIWAPQKPDSSILSALPCLESNNAINLSSQPVKYVFSHRDLTAITQCESNQAYMQPVPMKQEESRPTIMLLPPQGRDGSGSTNPPCFFLVDTPTNGSPQIQYQHNTMLPRDLSPAVFASNLSTSANLMNPPQQFPSYSTMPMESQSQSRPDTNTMSFPWPSQFVSSTGTTSTRYYFGSVENTKHAPVDNTFFLLHGQQQPQYMSTAFNMPMGSTFFPTSCVHPSASNNCKSVNTNSPQCHNTNKNLCGNGDQERERRGGLPFAEDPIPIDITKTQLIVNFLPQFLTDDGFRDLFTPFGEIHTKPTKIIYDREARRGKGYGFVYYKDGRSTEGAIKTLNGFLLGGRMLKVRYADQQRSNVDCDSCGENDESDSTVDENILDSTVNKSKHCGSPRD